MKSYILGFDVDGTAVLQYGKGRQAVLNYAMDKFYDQTVTIVGTKGIIKVGIITLTSHDRHLFSNHRQLNY